MKLLEGSPSPRLGMGKLPGGVFFVFNLENPGTLEEYIFPLPARVLCLRVVVQVGKNPG